MTKEELDNLKELEYKIVCTKNLFSIDRGISTEYFNHLLRFDKEFHDEISKLRMKYYDKYQEQFKNISVNYG